MCKVLLVEAEGCERGQSLWLPSALCSEDFHMEGSDCLAWFPMETGVRDHSPCVSLPLVT